MTQQPPGSPGADSGQLTGTLRRGVRISAISLVATQAISFIGTLAMARLLSPAQVGLFAAGIALALFLQVFTESGLCSALIQRQGDITDVADTVFWVTLGTGLVTASVALGLSPVVGLVFGSAEAGLIAAAMSGSLVLYSLYVVPDYLMQRWFNFRRRMIVDPGTALTNAVVGVSLAACGFGVWSLVIGTYASLVFWVVASWSLAGWRVGRGRMSLRLLMELVRFTIPVLLNGIAIRARDLLETVVVGRYLDATSLGYYRYGKRLSALPGLAVVQIVSYVLFPAFSRLADDEERFRNAYLRVLGVLWFVAVPFGALSVAFGEPFVVLLFGERWRGAGVAFVAMAGVGLGEALRAVGQEAILGSGRSRSLIGITLVNLVAGVGLLVALVPLGLVGVALAVSATSLCIGATAITLSSRTIGVRLRRLLGRLWAPVLGSAVALGCLWPVEHLLVHADRHGVVFGLGLLTAEVAALIAVYVAVMRVIAPSSLREVLALFRRSGSGDPVRVLEQA